MSVLLPILFFYVAVLFVLLLLLAPCRRLYISAPST